MIVSPGNFEDMVNYPRACKERGIDYIFDPGQSLPMWNTKDLIEAIEGCRILIVNDYELELIIKQDRIEEECFIEDGRDDHHHPGRVGFTGFHARS